MDPAGAHGIGCPMMRFATLFFIACIGCGGSSSSGAVRSEETMDEFETKVAEERSGHRYGPGHGGEGEDQRHCGA